MANRHTLVAAVAIAVIAATIGYSALSAFSVSELQIRWHKEGDFDYLSTLFGGRVTICNDSPYPANLKSYSFRMVYDSDDLGTFTTGGANIAPKSTVTLAGSLDANDKRIAEMMFSFLDTELGGTQVTRIDGAKMSVHATSESVIMGFIPVSVSREYSGYEFVQMMNQKTNCDT